MVKRGVLLVASVVVLAVTVAIVAGRRSDAEFDSTCLVRFSLPLTSGTGTNYFDVNQTVALNELFRALRGPIYVQASQATGVAPATLAGRTKITPGARSTFFNVTVRNASSAKSAAEAGAVCTSLRDLLIRQRAAQRDAETARLQTQLVALGTRRDELVALRAPSEAETSELTALDAAYKANVALVAVTLARSADIVTSTAVSEPTEISADSTAQNLRIALAAVPLTCFLVIVVAEQGSKRRTANARFA